MKARRIIIAAASVVLWAAVIAAVWSGVTNLIAAWYDNPPQTIAEELKVVADPPRIAQLKSCFGYGR
jgi:hypothetical protein